MEAKINNNNLNKKIEFALSAIMFFAPLIKNNIKNDNKLTYEEKSFIYGFIKLGYLNIILLAIALVLQIFHRNTSNKVFQNISIWILILLAILLIIWCILAIFGKNINKNKIEMTSDFDQILYFIPIYNIYIRYKNHQFEWENSTIKSSIVLRSIFSLSLIFIPNNYVNLCLFIIILLKAICTVNWLNFGTKFRNFVNNIFFKNPEEIWWYIIWTVCSLSNKNWLQENINNQKKHFEFLFKTDNKQIIAEYSLLWLILLLFVYLGIQNNDFKIFIWTALIFFRYLIMIINRKHLPHIPVLREITNIFFKSKIIKNE